MTQPIKLLVNDPSFLKIVKWNAKSGLRVVSHSDGNFTFRVKPPAAPKKRD